MSLINKINLSRSIILNIIQQRGFKTDKYNNFTINEIDKMYTATISSKANQDLGPLDMIIEGDNKVVVKYILNQKIRATNLINSLEEIMDNLSEGDTLIFITNDKLNNESIDELLESIYTKNNIFVQIFWINTIIRDITNHEFVPKHEIISNEDKEALLEKYNISSYTQLPIILKNDPVAKYYGGKKGDVFKITRPSETAAEYVSYRYCQ